MTSFYYEHLIVILWCLKREMVANIIYSLKKGHKSHFI